MLLIRTLMLCRADDIIYTLDYLLSKPGEMNHVLRIEALSLENAEESSDESMGNEEEVDHESPLKLNGTHKGLEEEWGGFDEESEGGADSDDE